MVVLVDCLIFASMMFIFLLPINDRKTAWMKTDGRQQPVRAAGGFGRRPSLAALTRSGAVAGRHCRPRGRTGAGRSQVKSASPTPSLRGAQLLAMTTKTSMHHALGKRAPSRRGEATGPKMQREGDSSCSAAGTIGLNGICFCVPDHISQMIPDNPPAAASVTEITAKQAAEAVERQNSRNR
jgi:hypothetical protein